MIVPLVLMSCAGEETQDDGGAAAVSESTEAPFGLDTVDLPDTYSGLLAVFDEMPEAIDGVARIADDDALAAQYGRLDGLFAALQSESGSGAGGVSVVESMSSFEDESGAQVEGIQLDPAADLVWLFGSFTGEGGTGLVHVAMWGEPDGEWLFAVNAGTPEMREALVRAFGPPNGFSDTGWIELTLLAAPTPPTRAAPSIPSRAPTSPGSSDDKMHCSSESSSSTTPTTTGSTKREPSSKPSWSDRPFSPGRLRPDLR